MAGSFMTRAMSTPISHATTAGLLLGAVQAAFFTLRARGSLGMEASAHAGLVILVGLVGFVVGTVTWWLFVARRKPAQMSVSRGIIIGALCVVISTAMFPIAQLVTMLVSGMRTESPGNLMEAAGEGALLGVAGIALSLVSGWMNVLAAMIVGGMLTYWYRRGAGAVPPDRFPESEQAPLGRMASAHGRKQRMFGYVAVVLLLLIIPVKLLRYGSAAGQIVVGVAPSLLGPAGLLFLLLSSPGRLSKLTAVQMGILVGAVSVSLEVVQLVPRPGILGRVRYTFDVLDLVATLVSVSVAAVVAGVVLRGSRAGK